MKKPAFPRTFPAFFLPLCGPAILLVLVSCPLARDDPGFIRISLITADSTRTAVPSASMELGSARITGSGPAGAAFDLTVAVEGSGSPAASSAEIEVSPGTWIISAQGFNGDSQLVGEGSTSVYLLPGETRVAEVLILPVRGTGSIVIEVSWPQDLPSDALVRGTITALQAQEEYEPVLVSIPLGSGPSEYEGLPAGYHTLALSLVTGETTLAGSAQAVRVASGFSTSVSISFILPSAETSVSVSVRMSPPLTPSIGLPFLPYPRSFPLRCSAIADGSGGTLPADSVFTWYLNGSAAGAGSSMLILTDDLPSESRLDLVASSNGAAAAGSVGVELTLFDPPALDRYLLFRSCVDGMDGVDGLRGVRSVCVHPSGSPYAAFGYDENEISLFRCETDPLGFSFIGTLRVGFAEALNKPVSGCFSAASAEAGFFFYAACPGNDSIQVFSVSPDSFSAIATVVSTEGLYSLDGVCSCAVTPNGRFLYAAASGADTIVCFTLAEGIPAFSSALAAADGPGALMDAPTRVLAAPDGAFLYVSAQSGDSLLCLAIDQDTGELSVHTVFTDGTGGAAGLNGAEGLSVSPDGRSVYAAAYYDDCVSHFRWDPGFTAISLAAEYRDGTAGISGLDGCRDVAVSPAGTMAAAAASGSDTVVLFSRDPATGELAQTSSVGAGGERPLLDAPRNFIFNPDGSAAAVACSGSHEIAFFRIPPAH